MSVHPNVREVVAKLEIPSPIKKYFSNNNWEIDLSNNTNPYLDNFSNYPDIQQNELKNLYLDRILSLKRTSGQIPRLTPDNVLFTVGSLEGIDILLRTFCEPNKDIICILHPAFSAYEHWGMIHNVEVKNIPLSGEDMNTFSLEEIVKINPKMVFMCNPNNPIGSNLDGKMIEKLCGSIDGFVVVDEAYIEFSDQPSSMALLNQHNNLIILRTLSKAWGLAGVRCGIIMADKRIIHSLRYVQLPFSFSSLTQAHVSHCLSAPEKTFASWQRIKRDRQLLTDALSGLEAVEKVFKSDTNFLMVVFKDAVKVLELLKQHKIQVLDCSASVPNAIRVSLGTVEQNERFLEVIRDACQ